MTINEIKKSALLLFLEKGYEGTSLSDIATAVGIKKQSIYSHFKNKDDLFLTIVNEVVQEEITFLHELFNQDYCNLEQYLENFLLQIKNRYIKHEDESIKFVLRISFMPPSHLKKEVFEKADLYFYAIEALVTKAFLDCPNYKDKSSSGTFAFMTLLDGLLTALLYGSEERFNKKFEASWEFYLKGLKN